MMTAVGLAQQAIDYELDAADDAWLEAEVSASPPGLKR